MPERTRHGQERHEQGARPTDQAFHDRDSPKEIYQDVETGNWIYVGLQGRTHIFTPDGRHHTSFRTSRRGRQRRVQSGRWIHAHSDE